MLRAYSNQDDIVIGTPVANRHYLQIEYLIGFFVNSLVLRTSINSNMLLKEFIKKIGAEVVEAQLHQDLPFEKLVEKLNITKDTSRHPIFQVMFSMEGFGIATKNNYSRHKVSVLEEYRGSNSYNIAKFDISSFIDDSRTQLRGSFNYAVSLYNEGTINNFIKTYIYILEQFSSLLNNKGKQEQITIAKLSYLPTSIHQQVITKWTDTKKEYPDNKTIHLLFEEQVEQTPNNIAIIYEETQLTYKELNIRANQLANYIRQKHDIKPDTLITLCLDRSEYMLIAILAVLKAGGAYVPIDPAYPNERISYILQDTHTKLILTNEIYMQRLQSLVLSSCSDSNSADNLMYLTREEIVSEQLLNQLSAQQSNTSAIELLAIDSIISQEQLSLQHITNPITYTKSHNLAYVIYTSGTTGNPKGVMIEHKGIVNRIKWMNTIYLLKESDRILQKTSYAFDVSVWELFWANWYGAAIVFTKPEGHKDISYLIELINKETITIIHFVPSMFTAFKDTLRANINALSSLKYIFCSGEALILSQIKECHRLLPHIGIYNLYGPTEASIDVLYYDCSDKEIRQVYIGQPIDNTIAYVLDTNLTPLPIGGIGELYIGGVGLARGYLNKSDLTAEKFIANPFQIEGEKRFGKNTRLYKTGDLVRWLSDGNLEYIGRNDFQVKIRGYRIELGEIENVLLGYAGIKQSTVLAKEHLSTDGTPISNKYLVGYYVADCKLEQEKILSYLQTKLPDYMIPTALMYLPNLPLTINGKLDRKALPNPEFTNSDSYVAPRNELEKQVCQIWADVLGLAGDKIGIYDDFFKLGGNSLLAIKLVSKINSYYQSHLKVSDIFVYKNIELLLPNLSSEFHNCHNR